MGMPNLKNGLRSILIYYNSLCCQLKNMGSVKNFNLQKGSTQEKVWKALVYGTDFMFKEVSTYKSNIHDTY
jgi:hypothetical protein